MSNAELREAIDDWVRAVSELHASVVPDGRYARAAAEAAAILWSGSGYQDAPPRVQQMLVQAIEVGYLTALQNVRDGDFDGDIRMWRPDLPEA
jgi:hypothetical protein